VQKYNDGYDHILNTPLYGTVFNYCVLTMPVIYGSYFYNILGGTFDVENIHNNILYIIVFSGICFFINTFIISVLFSISNNKNIFYSIISNIKLGLLNIFAMAPFGIILAIIFSKYSYLGVLLLMFPIILARYTFSLYIDSKSQYVQTVDAFMHAVEVRDKYTKGHSKRVAEISTMIARELKYNEWKIEQLNIAALLHDVGKLGIDDNILNKAGKLTEEEFDMIKKHPQIGCDIIKDIKNLEYASSIVRHHHERYDGRGYPSGKKAEELNLDVFIVQLADSVDAMATDRPYRKALSGEEITDEIKRNSGTQFHPKVVDAYFRALKK
jgi:putative nucleotidyltransferase with HDIG domain